MVAEESREDATSDGVVEDGVQSERAERAGSAVVSAVGKEGAGPGEVDEYPFAAADKEN